MTATTVPNLRYSHGDEECDENNLNQSVNIEIKNDVDWESLGLSLISVNIEVDDEEQISLFMEISGELKESFMLSGALYDFNGKIRETDTIEFFSADQLKYRGKVNTIVSYTFFVIAL